MRRWLLGGTTPSLATVARVPKQPEAAPGHDLFLDPPAALTRVERWTCSRCGRAVLRNGSHVYGSATTEPCDSNTADGGDRG